MLSLRYIARKASQSIFQSQTVFISQFNRFNFAIQQKIDPDENPDQYREDRSLGLAEAHHKNDKILNEILKKDQTLDSLQSYFNTYYKNMNDLHYSYMLYKTNQLYNESMKVEQSFDKKLRSRDSLSDKTEYIKTHANNLFKLLTFYLVKNISNMEPHALQSTINVLSMSHLDKSELKRNHLEEFENKIMEDLPKYYNLDLANCIASLARLTFVPRQIIESINQMQKLTTFNKYSCMIILESLVDTKYKENLSFYDKLFEQLKQSSAGLNTKLANRVLQILNKFKSIYPERDMIEMTQFYIDRFNDSIKDGSQPVETELILSTLEITKELHNKIQSHDHKTVDLNFLNELCLKLIEDRIEKLRPDQILRAFTDFQDERLKQRLMQSILQHMRDNKFDVRKLNFQQLSDFIDLVTQYQKGDLQAFFRYVSSCVDQEYFSKKQLSENFHAFTHLFYLFIKEGFVTSYLLGQLYYKYILVLKDNVFNVKNEEIINLLWALTVAEEIRMPNPLIPKLFEKLYDFDRTNPLTSQEKLELYQLHIYSQELIKNGKWPKEFKEVIPKRVVEICEEEFQQFDRQLYPEIQLDIAKKLLKLRVTFQENAKFKKAYRVDFKLFDCNKVILLKGNEQVNQKNLEWLGIYGMKYKYLANASKEQEIAIIDIDNWKKMSEENQFIFLFNLAKKSTTQQSSFSAI